MRRSGGSLFDEDCRSCCSFYINIFTWKGFEECVGEKTAHLATLKSKIIYLITFSKRLQWLNGMVWMAEKSSWDQANRRQKLGLVWRNRKKISQIIKDYFYLPFFLLIILWLLVTGTVHMKNVAGPNHLTGYGSRNLEKFGSGFRDWEWRIPIKTTYMIIYVLLTNKKRQEGNFFNFYCDLFLKLSVYFEQLTPVVDPQSECESESPSEETPCNAIWYR